MLTDTECLCQEACSANPQCETFTFDYDSGICSLTEQCDSVSACETCVYGPAQCDRVCGDCYQPGTCSGILVEVTVVSELCICVDMCKNNTACEYMNYKDQICTLLRDCKGGVDGECSDCRTGPKNCPNCNDCSQPGECMGTALDVFTAEDICECKNSCLNSTQGCEYISFDTQFNTCTELSSCGSVDTSVPHSAWMPKNCGNEGCGNCLYPGSCVSDNIVNIIFADSVCDCKGDCENNIDCNFWTFNDETEVCTMTADCDGGVLDDEASTYGPKQCAFWADRF